MPFPPDLSARIQAFAVHVQSALSGLFRKLGEKTEEIWLNAQLIEDRLLGKVPAEKRRTVIIGAISGFAGILVLLLFFAAGTPEKDKTEGQTVKTTSARSPGREIIPPDDVFLPDEPDFVPGVILEREQRAEWTAADVDIWWQDPLKNGEEPWRSLIEKTVDEILESVP